MARSLASIVVPPSLLLGALLLDGPSRWVAAALCLASSAVVMTGLLLPRSRLYGKSLSAGPARNRVALTFDDGPHPVDTPAILSALELSGAKATFFFVGEKARRHPALVRRAADSGHELGAHSDTHPWWFSLASRARLEREVRESAATLARLSGHRPRYFRPPMGHKGLALESILQEEGLTMVAWSVRPFDTVSRDPETIRSHLLERAAPGGILLLHEGIRRRVSGVSHTVLALPGILSGLRERGLEPVTLRELLEEEP
jgi:peptidoglycan/xylan/chitin deacetylase (PgdA/CDA1 family)